MWLRLLGWGAAIIASILLCLFLVRTGGKDAAIEAYTLMLAVFTGVLCAATIELWLSAARQAADGRLNNRAYIAVEPRGLAQWRGQPGRFLGLVHIANAGVLPARKVTWKLLIEMTNDGDRKDFPLPLDRRGSQLVVGKSFMARGTPPISNGGFDYCFVWGAVEYDDGYGQRRFTHFCHRYNCKQPGFQSNLAVAAEDGRQHEFGNAAD
jgi:hypothetical protein